MIKKPLAIILAFFIVFSPVYSYAVLPALVAAAASAGGRVLLGNVIHNVKKAALSKAGMAWMIAGGGAAATVKSAIETDGWTIDYGSGGGGSGGSWDAPNGGGVDSEGNIDISIYKLQESPDDDCFKIYICPTDTYDPKACFNSPAEYHQDWLYNPPQFVSTVNDKYSNFTLDRVVGDYQKFLSDPNRLYNSYQITIKYSYKHTDYTNKSTRISAEQYPTAVRVDSTCPMPANKTYMQPDQFYDYLTINNVTINQAGDNVKNVYNYDYSQHPNITINNNTTGGNSLNNDLSLNVDPNADIRVSPRLRLDIESNKVNLDNVNDENCTKNEAGEYDNCTGEPGPEEEETDPDDPNNPSPEEPPPIECSANGFYKKICDWMDWTKENPTPSEEAPVDIKNIEAENTNKIDMAGECPAPYDLNFTIAGYAQNNSISYEPLCGALEMLKPIFIGSGALSGMFILMGYSRPSGTGAN